MMTLTAAVEPMRIANYLAPSALFQWTYLSCEGGTISASNAMAVESTPIEKVEGHVDIVIICGSWGCEHYVREGLFQWLRSLERRGTLLVSMECGVYVLARAGLLANRMATTHWSIMAGFAEQFPKTRLSEQLFTVDGAIITCAGGTGGLDVMLHIIAKHFGNQLASEIADQVLHHPMRIGESPQRHTMGATTEELHPDVKASIALMEQHLEEPLSVPHIAALLDISQRQLERLFQQHMGCSVVQFSRLLRLQYARVLLTSTRMSIREVSVACGFNSLSYFSQAFTTCFDRRPSEYRQAWPETEQSPSWPGTVFSFVENARNGLREQGTQAERVLKDFAEHP